MRSTEATVRAWFAAVNAHDAAAIAETLADDFTWTLWDATTTGRDVSREAWALLFEAFPDYRMDILDIVTTGDKAAIRCTISGTHRGPLRFRGTKSMDEPYAASGRAFRADHALSWMETRNGKLTINRAFWQPATMLQQLGLAPR